MEVEEQASNSEFQKPLIKSRIFKQYNRKDCFMEHVRVCGHSVHEPKCGVCGKHCKSFREHLIGMTFRRAYTVLMKTALLQ